MMNPRKTILLVDDEAHVRHVMSFKLKAAGYNVLTAANGEEAFEQATVSPPHLVVTDMQMPRMNGLELAKRLAGDPRTATVPVIMVTSREFEIGPEQTAGTKVKRVMSKPFSPLALVNAVKEMLGG
jgi:CheY-like chemotaxis protein